MKELIIESVKNVLFAHKVMILNTSLWIHILLFAGVLLGLYYVLIGCIENETTITNKRNQTITHPIR